MLFIFLLMLSIFAFSVTFIICLILEEIWVSISYVAMSLLFFLFLIVSLILSNTFIFEGYNKVYDLAPDKHGNYVSLSSEDKENADGKNYYANFYSYQTEDNTVSNRKVKIVKSNTENATVEINKSIESFWFIDYKYNKEYIINIPNNTEIDKGEFELDEDKALLVKNRSQDN